MAEGGSKRHVSKKTFIFTIFQPFVNISLISVSLNLFGLGANVFPILEQKFQHFLKKNGNSPIAEFYLPTAVTAPDVLNKIITIKTLPTRDRWLGMTYPDDRLFVENQLDQWIAQGYIKSKKNLNRNA
jgi:hypothetical protein